jgi:hypothetical protein
MLGVEMGVMGARKPSWGLKDAAGAQKMLLGLETRSWGSKSVAGWLKWVVEGSWVVETRAGGLKDEAGGLKMHCWWLRHVAGVDNTWLGVKNA